VLTLTRSSTLSDAESRAPSPIHCAVALACVVASLRLRGFAKTLRSARWLADRPMLANRANVTVIDHAARNVALSAAFFPCRVRCLEQSLALFVLLRRRGVNAELRLGVQPYRFRAHAWVECDGVPINENGELIRGLTVLPDIPL